MITRYSYDGLYNAVKENPTLENIEKLVYWLEMMISKLSGMRSFDSQ